MQNHDSKYLLMAKIWAECSHAKRLKVGAIIVKNNTIISDGYNGTPSGFPNECEDENGNSKRIVLHAEANAISKIAKSNNSSEGATIYTLVSPCLECAKLIIQSGIRRVVYEIEYRKDDGLELLKEAGVAINKIDCYILKQIK